VTELVLNHRLQTWLERGAFLPVNTFGHRVFLIDAGEKTAPAKDTLLLFHGFPESSYSYSWALPFDIALEVWRKSGICGGHVLSHDMGDAVLTEVVVRMNEHRPHWFSEGFKSVTFTNGGMVLSKAKLRIGQKALMSSVGERLSPVMHWYPFFRQQIISADGNAFLKEEQIKDLHEAIVYQSWPGLFHYLISYLHERLRFENTRWLPAVQQLKVPVHISWGTDDRVNPETVPLYLKEQVCPQATFSLTEGLGHFCQIQDPEKWVKPLNIFWNGLR
jgi:pimeloyl-ACP methyl ester carboxylesterase